VLGKALQAVVPAGDDPLLRAGVALNGPAIVEDLIAGFDYQQIPPRRNARHVEFFPLPEVRFGEHVRFTGVQVLLRTEIGAKPNVRIDGRIDEHGARAVLLGEIRRVEAAEGRADVAHARPPGGQLFGRIDRVGR
jgi:hypothetical protein